MSPRALLVVPATNTTMERELTALCPDLAPFAVARVESGASPSGPEGLEGYIEATLRSLEPFRSERHEIVFHGCTSAGFLAGPEGNARVVDAIGAQSGAQVVSTAQAMVDVLLAHSLKRISVLTPYTARSNDGLRSFLAAFGIAVERLDSFLCQSIDEMLQLTEAQVFERAGDGVAPSSAALFLACTQMPTLGVIPALRDRLAIPVWSSISASAWKGAQVSQRMAA